MSEHSKLPFSVFSRHKVIQIYDAEGNAVCHWMGFDSADQTHKEKLANAELIVTACNAHYEMLEALEAILPEVHCLVQQAPPHRMSSSTQRAVELAQSAIEKGKL